MYEPQESHSTLSLSSAKVLSLFLTAYPSGQASHFGNLLNTSSNPCHGLIHLTGIPPGERKPSGVPRQLIEVPHPLFLRRKYIRAQVIRLYLESQYSWWEWRCKLEMPAQITAAIRGQRGGIHSAPRRMLSTVPRPSWNTLHFSTQVEYQGQVISPRHCFSPDDKKRE